MRANARPRHGDGRQTCDLLAGQTDAQRRPFDVAIDGSGFFRVERDGRHAFTRNGEFTRAADGSLRNADGWHYAMCEFPRTRSPCTLRETAA